MAAVHLHAEDRWANGTLDTIEVETLQPQASIEANRVSVGQMVPLPLDMIEMGMPPTLRAKVVAIQPCPPIAEGPGRVVLTTVNHLNPQVFELQLADGKGHKEFVRPTRNHKFYSADRKGWVTVDHLHIGEHVPGLSDVMTVVAVDRLPGVHRVYNMTVERDHVYHVTALGALVHNDCSTIAENAANGRAFEDQGLNFLRQVQKNVQDQVSIVPFDGNGNPVDFHVRLDAVGTDLDDGTIHLTDFKSSNTAGFTPNQEFGYPLLEQNGGIVIGDNGGEWYPRNTIIPPTAVDTIRPDDLPTP